jgi:hypothetical protein
MFISIAFSCLELKDWVLVLVGAGLGCYASLIASRILDFHLLKQTVLNQAQLLSAILDKGSYDFVAGYTLDRMLHAYSVLAFSKGHKKAAALLKELGDEVEAMFTVIRRSDDLWNVTTKKNRILERIAGISANRIAYLCGGPQPKRIIEFYSQKEQVMVSQACADRARTGQSPKEYNG